MDQNTNYEVIVLFDGYSHNNEQGSQNTMTAWDGDKLQDALYKYGLKCSDIDYVVCTHGHSDHIGYKGLYGIAGDLFENKDDEDIWETVGVDDAELQVKHRNEMLKYVDFIVPGHGPMFECNYVWDKRRNKCSA
ncbi:hypothetical protein MML48_4g00003095 [Holotrichia oblita]|uniref:Uncharacterized protein n=1 Tax=Holotrichia oblita TaxID=644536 RepID=A0ACB9T7N3_HOLOL|nr:hypothetical protein MML48_4g00003095 [Holotrichia oblita]